MKISQLLSLSICLLATACDIQKAPPAEKATAYKVTTPLLKDTSYSTEYVAEIQSVQYAEVRSKVKGHIEKIYVDEGQPVKKGQLLFTLNFLDFEKEVQKANAAYKSALADLKSHRS